MSAREFWEDLARRDITVTVAAGRLKVSGPAGAITPEIRQQLAERRDDLVSLLASDDAEVDAGMEARRQRVLEILAANPGFRYAVVTDSDSEPGAVVVHIGIRGVVSGEIVIAEASYDGIVLLKALEAQP